MESRGTVVENLPEFVTRIIEKGGWLIGSSVRNVLVGENAFNDLDVLIPHLAAAHYVNRLSKKKLPGRGRWEIDGRVAHVIQSIDFVFLPMFDVDMLGLSKKGVGLRPLNFLESSCRYDVPQILQHVANKEFYIFPAHERSRYYDQKLVALKQNGWRESPTSTITRLRPIVPTTASLNAGRCIGCPQPSNT